MSATSETQAGVVEVYRVVEVWNCVDQSAQQTWAPALTADGLLGLQFQVLTLFTLQVIPCTKAMLSGTLQDALEVESLPAYELV